MAPVCLHCPSLLTVRHCTTHSEISLALLGLLVLNQKLNIFAKSILTFPHFSPKKSQVRLALSRNGVGDRTGSSVDLNSGRLFSDVRSVLKLCPLSLR